MQEQLSVQVRDGQVRNNPSFLGAIVATLHYGDRVSSLQTTNSWVEVALPGGKKGWMHLSALTEKEIVLNANAEQVKQSASSNELALAGKGFNKQVEEQFRKQNSHANFAGVDAMESYRVSMQEIERFLKEGGLTPKGGAV